VWKTGWFIASSTLLIITASVLLLRYRANRIRKKEKEKLFYEIELAHNELKALRAQMDPHFIFNSLNSIQALIMTQDEDAALAYLNKFAKLMRMTLSNSEKSFISLREELDALRLYLELETLRWGNKFTYQISIDVEIDLEDYKIPTMLIQPYVENAIVHGVVRKETGMGDVEVRINLSDTHIICIVDDNGIGRQMAQLLQSKANTPKHESVGMKITAERLQAINRLHNSRLSANIIDKVDDHGNAQGTTVQIFIPI
jgi:LytS/YehU family sensor histidine kinase